MIDRKPLLERRNDAARVIDRQRRLGHVGQLFRIRDLQPGHVGHRLHQMHLGRNLPDRTLNLGMASVPNQHNLTPAGGITTALVVNLGNQGAGGIEHR